MLLSRFNPQSSIWKVIVSFFTAVKLCFLIYALKRVDISLTSEILVNFTCRTVSEMCYGWSLSTKKTVF